MRLRRSETGWEWPFLAISKISEEPVTFSFRFEGPMVVNSGAQPRPDGFKPCWPAAQPRSPAKSEMMLLRLEPRQTKAG
jgi:hypothetical protein